MSLHELCSENTDLLLLCRLSSSGLRGRLSAVGLLLTFSVVLSYQLFVLMPSVQHIPFNLPHALL